ncbi:MAG: LysR family transcriptional regulator [Oceanospirillales bacterium]|uniref:LysR family transcriptional regulator n=1 Tax=Marinobacterium halophilum TaxID=267374 RepID=A0A2P8EZS8_9GAMM|nr:LysR family transcriptional regulator [Marinobacterium halophilum]MBR9828670.1 LysR family transcriptional regulator [Oceanospirillales bacterium]PSL14956.1 LysR family transcriptional regulator [Marinobacterium halophilum]
MKGTEFKGQLSDVDLRMLRIFRAVVESGGFSAAEVELNISRAAISIAMADLEVRLGFKLCQRGRSGFSMTDEGRNVYEFTLQLLSSLEEFKTRVNSLHAHLKGELNIGITDNLVTMPRMHITRALSRLKEVGPEVRINIRMSPPNEIELAVLDGRLHVGIVPLHRALAGLDYLPLYDEESCLYCSNDHPLFKTTEVETTSLMAWDAVVPAYAQSADIKRHYQPLNGVATATDREGIAFLILTGAYIGFLPKHFAARWVDEGRMRAIAPETQHFITPFAVITRKGIRPNLVLDTYLEALRKIQTSA